MNKISWSTSLGPYVKVYNKLLSEPEPNGHMRSCHHLVFVVRHPSFFVISWTTGTLSFDQCVVCLSSIYGFWLPFWYLQTLAFCNKAWLSWSLFLSLSQLCPTDLSTFKNSRRYKNSTVFITIWMTVTKYPYLKWQWIVYLLLRCFVSSITANIFTELDCIYE